jgi:hypothetical protein
VHDAQQVRGDHRQAPEQERNEQEPVAGHGQVAFCRRGPMVACPWRPIAHAKQARHSSMLPKRIVCYPCPAR